MNYFPFHLGDYAAHTAHLEPMEDLAYRRLLDQYYLREGPLPADTQITAKLVRMRSMVADVESVLNEFFQLTDAGWMHSRCEIEIEHMQDKRAKAKASAAASVKSRQAFADKNSQERRTNAEGKDSERSTDVEINQTNVELPTPTPTPTPEEKHKRAPRFDAQAHLVGLEVDPAIAADWIKLRKAKRAEVTATAIDGIVREAEKAELSLDAALRECCSRGWAGFKAEWMRSRDSPASASVAGKPSRHSGFEGIDYRAGVSADGRF